MWTAPQPPPAPEKPLTPEDIAANVIEDTIWETLEAQDSPMGGPYVDREMGLIDSSGSDVDMLSAAGQVVEALQKRGWLNLPTEAHGQA